MVERTRRVGPSIADYWRLKREGSAFPRPRARRTSSGACTNSTAAWSRMGRRPKPTANGLHQNPAPTKSATAALDKPPLIDGFVRAFFTLVHEPCHLHASCQRTRRPTTLHHEYTTGRPFLKKLDMNDHRPDSGFDDSSAWPGGSDCMGSPTARNQCKVSRMLSNRRPAKSGFELRPESIRNRFPKFESKSLSWLGQLDRAIPFVIKVQ